MNSPIDITNVTLFLLSLPVGGAAVVLLAQLIKKVFGMNSEKAIHAMVTLVSIVGAVVPYILKFKGLPPEVLVVSSPAVYGFSQWLYKSAQYVADYLPNVSGLLNKVSGMFTKTPAATPAVPVTTVAPATASTPAAPTSPEEFSL